MEIKEPFSKFKQSGQKVVWGHGSDTSGGRNANKYSLKWMASRRPKMD